MIEAIEDQRATGLASSSYPNLEPIVRELHTGWKLYAPLGMHHLMTEVGQVRTFRANLLDNGQSFCHAQVRRVRSIAEGVENQDVDATQQLDGAGRNGFRIRHVGDRAAAETVYRPPTVVDRDGDDLVPEEVERTVELVQAQIRFPAVERQGLAERVAVANAQFASRFRVRVDGQRRLRQVVELAQVVEPADMISVRVREENSLDTTQTGCNRLEAEFRGSIDQHVVFPEVQHCRRARSSIARIDRGAGSAAAPDDGYSVGGSCSEKCQSEHARSTTLVAPILRLWLPEDESPQQIGTDDTRSMVGRCRSFR